MSASRCQFLRIHAHRATAAPDLLAEANRVPSHCSHIERPRPARWIIGSPEEVLRELKSFMLKPQPVRPKSGGVRLRKARSDLRCLTDGVASYPVAVEYLTHAPDIHILKDWVEKTHHFLQAEFGSSHIATCLHLDESHPHFHFYIVGHACQLHPGLRAEFVDGRRIKDGKERRRRHINGLRAFLDRYYEQVSCRFGHSRGDHRRNAPRIPKRKDYNNWKKGEEGRDQRVEPESSSAFVVPRPK